MDLRGVELFLPPADEPRVSRGTLGVGKPQPRVDPSSAANLFIGRTQEMDTIIRLLLSAARLITLTGSGGIGKTRLAAEAVRRYQKATRAHVYWVRLAQLVRGCDIAAIEEEIARSVVDGESCGRPIWEALVEALGDPVAQGRNQRPVVLVLDNCEHVLDGAGQVIDRLLDQVAELSIVATSREAIGWVDEQRVPVPPLSQAQALTLFQRRSELTGHPVTGADQIATAHAICRRLHHHPLYIQLAAARLIRQPLAVILRELSGEGEDDKRMWWSQGPRLGAEPRHSGVSDVIAWSYDLCSDKERLLFERLSVFAAGYDTNPDDPPDDTARGAELKAIRIVCSDDTGPRRVSNDHHPGVTLTVEEIEGLLDRLVDRSLVSIHITPTTVRYFLLESLRVFAQQRLHERSTPTSDEPARLAARHRQYYRDHIVATAPAANWFSAGEQDLLESVWGAWDNILIAIDSSLATPDTSVVGLELCAGLLDLGLAYSGKKFRQIQRCTERALRATLSLTPPPTELRTRTTAQIAAISQILGEDNGTAQLLDDCVAACLPALQNTNNWRETATTDYGLPAHVEFGWGMELLIVHQDPAAITVLTRAREKFEAIGDHGGAGLADLLAVATAGLLGTPQQAHAHVQRCLDHATASGGARAIAWAQLAAAIAMTKHGNTTEALDLERTALASLQAIDDQWGQQWAVQIRIWTLAQIITDLTADEHTDHDTLVALATEAAQLMGGVASMQVKIDIDLAKLGPFATETDKAIGVIRTVLGPEAFTAAQTQGTKLRPELGEVQRLALGTLPSARLSALGRADTNDRTRWNYLTTAEREVAILAAAGWTNTAIAARRGNSTRTVDAQVASIFQKMMINSRKDIVGFVPEGAISQIRAEVARLQKVVL